MNIEERAAIAAEWKRTGKYNCCQAVIMALIEETGLTEEQALSAASGFCVGMGSMENTCGALIGAGIAAGLKVKGQGTVKYTRKLSDSFRNKCGAYLCKDLKGRDTGAVLCPCDECVKNAVLAYGEVMEL